MNSLPAAGPRQPSDAIHQIVVVKRLEKVTNDTVFQSPPPCSVVGIGSNEDCWNLVPRVYQARAEFDSRHPGHMDVSDQAGGLVETARCEKIGRRWESFDGVTQRSHESSHGLAKEFIIFDDRDQWRFDQSALQHRARPSLYGRFKRCRASV